MEGKLAAMNFIVTLILIFVASVQALDWSQLQPRHLKRPSLSHHAGPGVLKSSSEGRIIGGSVARRHQFPHHVGIVLDLVGFCSGSLISPTAVVTVAHCARGASLFDVVLGAQNIEWDDEPDRQTIRSRDVTLHPFWDDENINNDIAVIVLPQAVSGTGVQPARLPARSQIGQSFLGQMARVSGWGLVSDYNPNASSELKFVDLTVISNAQCNLIYGGLINESKICMDTNGGLEGVCGGDSGGALVIYEADGEPCQIGIVSFGGDGCESGEPAVFTRITEYLDWLQETTGVEIRP